MRVSPRRWGQTKALVPKPVARAVKPAEPRVISAFLPRLRILGGAGNYFLCGLNAENGQRGIGDQSDLLQDTGLVPIDVFVGELALAETNDDDQRNFDVLVSRCNAG